MVERIKSEDLSKDVENLFKYSKKRFDTFLKHIDFKPIETISNEYFLLTKFRTKKTFVIKSKNLSIDYVFIGSLHFLDKTERDDLLNATECICSNLDTKNIKANEKLLFYLYDKTKNTQEHTYLVFKCVNTKVNKVKF